MNRILKALKEVVIHLEERKQRYALIGGLAVGCRGQARATKDVDLSVWVELGEEGVVIADLLSRFSARIEGAEGLALSHRILVLEASNRVPIDIALASFPFEEEMIGRASPVAIQPKLVVSVLSPEDLVVSKALAGRSIDWFDIQGVFDRMGPRLDYHAIVLRLQSLGELVDLGEVLPKLAECRAKSEDLGDIELM